MTRSKATKTKIFDERHMAVSLELARRGLGRVWPNPAVGCVVVRESRVVGRGWTQPGGRPHAETEALDRAAQWAQGATAYVNLEPCAHEGKTRPCVDALVRSGIARCVVALEDPDPRVSGRGIAQMRQAGLVVRLGILANQARELNEGFFSRINRNRPTVTLKFATTLDGFVATSRGESQWITGALARQRGHLMRAEHDAVMVGIGTAIADNPALTCRLYGMTESSPVRIILDSNLRLPLTSKLVVTASEYQTWIVTKASCGEDRRAPFEEHGVQILEVDTEADGSLSMEQTMNALGQRGITRLLVEGGPTISGSLVRSGLVDRIAWFRAPTLLGGDGVKVTVPFGTDNLADAVAFRRVCSQAVGEDMLEIFTVVS